MATDPCECGHDAGAHVTGGGCLKCECRSYHKAYPLDLDRLEALHRNATAMPWFSEMEAVISPHMLTGYNRNKMVRSAVCVSGTQSGRYDDQQRADMELIAESRNALPQLLAMARRCGAAERELDAGWKAAAMWQGSYIDVDRELAEAVLLLRRYLSRVYPEVEAFIVKHNGQRVLR